MPPDLRTRLAAIFKANPNLLAVEFAYKGRRGDGGLPQIAARDKSGLPLTLAALKSPTKLAPEGIVYDALFALLQALVPGWVLGLGSKGTGTVNRALDVRLTHTAHHIQAVTRTITA